MKIFNLVLFFLLVCIKSPASDKNNELVTRTPIDRNLPIDVMVINYSYYEGSPLDLIYDPQEKFLSIRLPCTSNGEQEIKILEKEIEKICSRTALFRIGKYQLVYSGGTPDNIIYFSIGEDFAYVYIIFSRRSEIKGDFIYFFGTKTI